MSENLILPKWHEGTWWVTSVKQKARWVRTSEAPWLDPFLWKFEVVNENERKYLLRITYPERQNNQDDQYFEFTMGKDDLKFIEGTIHIGEKDIPMDYDFLATVLKNHPPGVDRTGSLGKELLFKGRSERNFPEETLKTYTTRTHTGGTVVSSTELPYHLRIREANYSIELKAWFNEG